MILSGGSAIDGIADIVVRHARHVANAVVRLYRSRGITQLVRPESLRGEVGAPSGVVPQVHAQLAVRAKFEDRSFHALTLQIAERNCVAAEEERRAIK